MAEDSKHSQDQADDADESGLREITRAFEEAQRKSNVLQLQAMRKALEQVDDLQKLMGSLNQTSTAELDLHKEIMAKTQGLLRTVNSIPSEARSAVTDFISRASSYLSDAFPLPTTILPVYTGLITWSNDYLTGSPEDCDWDYHALRWGALGAALAYLAAVHYMNKPARVKGMAYARLLSCNLLTFIIFVILLNGMPPMECYTAEKHVTIAGVGMLAAFYIVCELYEKGVFPKWCYSGEQRAQIQRKGNAKKGKDLETKEKMVEAVELAVPPESGSGDIVYTEHDTE